MEREELLFEGSAEMVLSIFLYHTLGTMEHLFKPMLARRKPLSLDLQYIDCEQWGLITFDFVECELLHGSHASKKPWWACVVSCTTCMKHDNDNPIAVTGFGRTSASMHEYSGSRAPNASDSMLPHSSTLVSGEVRGHNTYCRGLLC